MVEPMKKPGMVKHATPGICILKSGLTKPFETKELWNAIKCAMERTSGKIKYQLQTNIDDMGIRILIADDPVAMRKLLFALIQNQTDMAIIGEAGNGKIALQMTRRFMPDVVYYGYRYATDERYRRHSNH